MIAHAKTCLPPRDISGKNEAPKLLPGHIDL